MQMDRITEAIAHFIGLFDLTVEEARLRDGYENFHAKKAAAPDLSDLPAADVPFEAPYQLLGYDPKLAYQALPQTIIAIYPWLNLEFARPEIPVNGFYETASPVSFSFVNTAHATSYRIEMPEVEPVGSVANYVHQGIKLSDNDYFSVGGHGLIFAPDPVDDTQLLDLAAKAAQFMPLEGLEMPGSAEEVVAFVKDAAKLLDAVPAGEQDHANVVKSDVIVGKFVNGEKVDGDLPKFEDHHSFDEETGDSQGNAKLTENGVEIDVSVSIETGGNTLVNNAILKSYWAAAPVTAVMGEHMEINAIIQINAWCDSDYVTSAVGDWIRQSDPTQAFNIASFERFDDFGEEAAAPDEEPFFPRHWSVTEIDGDLMIMSWLQQLAFITDNDIGIISSSGVSSRVYSGDNQAYNDISLEQIGFGYDLIIIGGNVYDASIIQQLNLLCDSDLVGAAAGFETTGEGAVSTSGNLLWNQAHIYNVGGSDRFETVPDAYRETAEKLAAGEDYLSDGVLSDSAFGGYGGLRVLYIKGDLLNLQYVKQTNILGDSDQLALAMNAEDAYPGASWSVTTGGNTLANNAAIMDLDSVGKTYVGGGQYSTDLLIQAEFISTDPDLGAQDPDVLVNEAIAFLDDEMAGAGEAQHAPNHQGETDYLHSDGVQTMLG
ncbi:hypothetical protein [Chelativorans sp. AA-79]|uniref:hypothetical protein n=1 Tax=Chelativorans sp. AA-79 TaxID=3028735 RepID=UPI0023F9A640|nr:hypothetical protein [Chelativorans sp. AA-79]WEX10468.1 hypothetical protein PVE73_05795 [Chelativorans sp. AA-79]